MKSLNDLSISDLKEGISNGKFSHLDIANACISRCQMYENQYHAWEIFDPEVLTDQAVASRRRFLSGAKIRRLEAVPFAVKDIFNTIDFPTQMGSRSWVGFMPGNDARVVHSLREAGAFIPGKTVTAEFAVHSLGKTINPFSKLHTPGTSSSGSAVAVSLRMVPAALGTQTAGSITRPASFCGVYGMKPSFGLLPRTGMLKTTDTLDTVGFFVVHQSDLRNTLDALRVTGGNYPIVHQKIDNKVCAGHKKNWRVAFMKTHTWPSASFYVKTAVEQWISQLALQKNVEVFEIEEPQILTDAHDVHSVIYEKALSYYFKNEIRRPELISPKTASMLLRGCSISLEHYLTALGRQASMATEVDSLLSEFDALVSLGTSSAAPLREEEEALDPSLMWTLTYLPTISIPLFRSPEGLPFSLQVCARRYDDYNLIDFTDMLVARELIPAESMVPGSIK